MPKFVSAQYVWQETPPKMLIRAMDDQGGTWWHEDDCTQGDWLDYIAAGGTIAPVDSTDQNIVTAPDDLFGGPTTENVLSGSGG